MEHDDLLSRVAARFAAGAPRAAQRTSIAVVSEAPLAAGPTCIPIPCIFDGEDPSLDGFEERPSSSSP